MKPQKLVRAPYLIFAMPNGLRNWKFEDVVSFLEHHHFQFASAPGGSHHFYKGFVDGEEKMTEVQYHAGKTINPRTLDWSIIEKSGIPKQFWLDWAKAGNKKAQKKIRYPGAVEWPEKQKSNIVPAPSIAEVIHRSFSENPE